MVSTKREDAKSVVERTLGKRNTNRYKKFVKNQKLNFWGKTRPRLFEDNCFYAVLYKLITGKGYQKLLKESKSWIKMTSDSLQRNTKLVLRSLAKYSRKSIKVGTVSEWKKKVRNRQMKRYVRDTNLWVDSCDFKLSGKQNISKKSDRWSYKENAPAQRFMMVTDGKGSIRKIWGGYSPKMSEADYFKIQKREIEKSFDGAVIVGDGAFYPLKDSYENLRFHAPIPKPNNKSHLTKEQVKYNDAVYSVRALSEDPFGWMKASFQELSNPFREKRKMQDDLVSFASVAWNEK